MNPTPHYRLYLDPEPEYGSHPGYRGPMHLSVYGVWVNEGCECLFADHDVFDPGRCWDPVETNALIPWHRIHTIEVMSND